MKSCFLALLVLYTGEVSGMFKEGVNLIIDTKMFCSVIAKSIKVAYVMLLNLTNYKRP